MLTQVFKDKHKFQKIAPILELFGVDNCIVQKFKRVGDAYANYNLQTSLANVIKAVIEIINNEKIAIAGGIL